MCPGVLWWWCSDVAPTPLCQYYSLKGKSPDSQTYKVHYDAGWIGRSSFKKNKTINVLCVLHFGVIMYFLFTFTCRKKTTFLGSGGKKKIVVCVKTHPFT